MRLAVLAAVALVALTGCPKEKRALSAARKSVEVAAQTVALIDREVADLYAPEAAQCLQAHETREGYQECMKRWDKTVLGVASMKQSLLLVEVALDAWEAGSPNGRDSLRDAAACFLESLVRLQTLLDDLGAETPALDSGIDYGRDLFGLHGVACPSGVTL